LCAEKSALASPADQWTKNVTKVTGTVTYQWDREVTYNTGGFAKEHRTIKWPVTFTATGASPDFGSDSPAEVTVQDEYLAKDANTGQTSLHLKYSGSTTVPLFGEMWVIPSSVAGSWTSYPDGQTYSGDYFHIEDKAMADVLIKKEDLVNGTTSAVDYQSIINGQPDSLRQPLPATGFKLSGTATSGNVTITWDLTGTPAQQQINVTSNKKYISPNEPVTFRAERPDGTLVRSDWSGGGTPKTGTGTTFTTRYNVAPGFQGLDEDVTAKAVTGGATATKTVKVLRPSGAAWATQWPGDNRISALAQPFQDNVARFNTALANAGAARHISAVYRPPERAHLMYYARRIGVGGMDPRQVPTPNCTIAGTTDGPIYVAWAHYDTTGHYDANASVNAANAMLSRRGYNIGRRPVAHPSRHEIRRAIDWNITWNGTLRIAWGPNGGPNGERPGTIDRITSMPQTGLNHDLWQVGRSYGVIAFNSVNRSSDPPHWSDTGH
jgi:hypothetical protein